MLKVEEVLKDPAHLKPEVVFAPTAQEFQEGGLGDDRRTTCC